MKATPKTGEVSTDVYIGRTRVRSRIQHVLIVTKARDNRLIKLTRKLALYLMEKRAPSPSSSDSSTRNNNNSTTNWTNDRGTIVYVDAQLQQSTRFDAAGMERDYPHLFKPVPRRRPSSSSGLGSMSTFPSSSSVSDLARKRDEGNGQGEGQLRYWTAELCSSHSNLFDFVVTVRQVVTELALR